MTLLEEARELMKAHLAANPHLSIASMARQCGIPATTARTIVQGEVRKTAFENIVGLLGTFMEIEEVNKLVMKHDTKSVGAAHLAITTQRKAKLVVAKGEFEYENPDQNIMALASSSNGITRSTIARMYGEFGIRRLENLMNAGLLREINNKIKLPEEYVVFPIGDTHKKVRLQAENWKPEDIDSGGFVFQMIQNTTDDGHAESLEIIKDCLLRLANLEKKYKSGDKVVMISFIGNLMTGDKQ